MERFMRAALAAGRRGLGSTWPNPAVGCVIVSGAWAEAGAGEVAGGRIVGVGTTAPGGRPHAETLALGMAGPLAAGATAYVTLEPCSHVGRTPPCADALIAAGVARVVIGCGDPDPRVDGAGAARLRAAGIAVSIGWLEQEARADLAGYLTRARLGRPLVTLKLASTLDGRIATGTGQSQWITGAAARREAHALRGRHDATLVGVGTVLADDPDLTCRIAGYARRQGVRVVADGTLRTPPGARLVASAGQAPTWLVHAAAADGARMAALRLAGVRLIAVPASAGGGVDPAAMLDALGAAGLTTVLAEGGARLAASLLRADLVDRIAWFHAPAAIGGDGMAAVEPIGVASLADMRRFRRVAVRPVGDDLLSAYERI